MKRQGKRLLPFVVASLVGSLLSLCWQSVVRLDQMSRRNVERWLSALADQGLASCAAEAETIRARSVVLASLRAVRQTTRQLTEIPKEPEVLAEHAELSALWEPFEPWLDRENESEAWIVDARHQPLAHYPSFSAFSQALPVALLASRIDSAYDGRSSALFSVREPRAEGAELIATSSVPLNVYAVVPISEGEEVIAALVVRSRKDALGPPRNSLLLEENAATVQVFPESTCPAWLRETGHDRAVSLHGDASRAFGRGLSAWRYDPERLMGVLVQTDESQTLSESRTVRGKIVALGLGALVLGLLLPMSMGYYRRRLARLARRVDSIAVARGRRHSAQFERSLLKLEKQLHDSRTAEAVLRESHRVLEEDTQRFARLSQVDALTDLANRRQFDEFLEREWRRGMRHNGFISLLLIDVDYFKVFVETYGHVAGDDCLREVARALASAGKRPGDLVARLGGEEFAVVLSDTDVEGARAVAHHIRSAVEALAIDHETTLVQKTDIVTITVGIATEQMSPMSGPSVVRYHADEALYLAKQDGRNCVRSYDDNAVRVESSTGLRVPSLRARSVEGWGRKGSG